MRNTIGTLAALLSAVAVLTGAFGAHGLQKITTDASVIEPYKTAVQYLLWHGLALLVLWATADRFTARRFKLICLFFVGGIFLFCGSLFLVTLFKIKQLTAPWLVYLTPIGGLFFVAGWVLLALTLIGKERN